MAASIDTASPSPISTGIAGLDDILRGGLTPHRLYLIEGDPGAGKTTLALQFLLEGIRKGEPGLYVTLAETKEELIAVGKTHGWDLTKINICEMVPSEEKLSPQSELTMFHPSEVELGETTKLMLAEVERVNATRIVLDSLSELRLIAQSSLRYRRQILALKQYFAGRKSTVLLLDDRTSDQEDSQLQSIAHGVISLEQIDTQLGAERRRLKIAKMRGVGFRGGLHDFIIRTGGLDVFPRLIAAEHHKAFEQDDLKSGNAALDQLLGGGIPRGTSTLLLGPAGTGKSVTIAMFAVAAAKLGQRTVMYVFDENISTLISRSKKVGLDIESHLKSGLIIAQQIDPAEMSPGELTAIIRREVTESKDGRSPAKIVAIDSLNGYLNAMPEEKFLTAQLHELLAYLGQRGVITMMTVAQAGIMSGAMVSPVDTTYLADNVLMFRYFEAHGEVRRALSVVKKRNGPHEMSIREVKISNRGIEIGPPLVEFQGILSGIPRYVGDMKELIRSADDDR